MISKRERLSEDEDDDLVAGCEICTRDDLIKRNFHFKPAMFLQNTSVHVGPKKRPGAGRDRWPIVEGTVGSDPGAKYVIKRDEVASRHASIVWEGDTDEYRLEDCGSGKGSYLLLSSGRACREAVELKDGDIFMLALDQTQREIRAQVDPSKYVKIKVKISPTGKEPPPMARKYSQRRTYTAIRSGDAPSLPSLNRQKAEELDLDAILMGFRSAAASETSSSESKVDGEIGRLNGSLLSPSEVKSLQTSENAAKHVVFMEGLAGEVEEASHELSMDMGSLQRNVYGGSSILEEESLLDAVWCDTEVPEEQMHMVRAASRKVGVGIAAREGSIDRLENLRQATSSRCQHELDNLFRRRVELEIIDGPSNLKGRKHEFGVHDVAIGSHRVNDFHIEGLAGFHVRIERDKKHNYWLRDLAVGQALSTLLVLSEGRSVPILPGDIFRFGKSCELTAQLVSDIPRAEVNESWECVAFRVTKTRKSLRYRQLESEEGTSSEAAYFVMSPSVEDIVIGRKVLECDIAVKDYEMPPYAASVTCYERSFFVSAMPESRKKGVFIELSRRVVDANGFNGKGKNPLGRLHLLERGDTVKVGRSQLTVALKKVEEADVVSRRRNETHRALRRVSLFTGLRDDELHNLASAVCTVEFKAGDVIIRQGSKVTGMFIIAKGEAHVYHESAPDKIVNKVKLDDVLGEMALFSSPAATASVRAATDMVCFYIDFYMAKAVIHPSNFEIIKTLVEHRTTQAHVHDLQQIKTLRNVGSSRLLLLSRRLFRVELTSPTALFEAGDVHECMYIVSSGSLYVSKESAPRQSQRRDSYRPLSRRPSFTAVPGGGSIFSEVLDAEIAGDREPFRVPYAVATNAEAVLFGLHRADFAKVMKMSDDQVREEIERYRINIDDLVPAHFASTRRNSFVPDGLMRNFSTDTLGQASGRLGAAGASSEMSAGKRSSNDVGFSFKLHRRPSVAPSTSGRILPDEFAAHGGSERVRSRRRTSYSGSKSLDEGSEGDTLAYIERLVAASGADSQESSESILESKRGSGSLDSGAVDAPDDDDTISLASTETADMSDLEDAAILTDSEAFDEALYSKRSDLEARLHGLTLAEIERELSSEPFYLVLKCISGPQKRQLFILTKSVTIIGRWTTMSRDEEVSEPLPGRRVISLNDRTVSRVNSIVQYRNGDFYLNDVESKYGTHLKLRPNEDIKLEVGDIVSCSQHEFEVFARVKLNFGNQSSSCCSIL